MKKLYLLLLFTIAILNANNSDSEIQYEKTKKFKIATSPINLIAGLTFINGEYAVTQNIGVGLTYVYIGLSDDVAEIEGSSLGINLRYFFDSFSKDGWYVNAEVESGSIDGSGTGYNPVKIDGDYTGFMLLGGYQWIWDSVFINLGFGMASYSGNFQVSNYDEDNIPFNGSKPQGEFNLGFAF